MITITALHLYHGDQLSSVLRKLEPALAISQAFWIACADPVLLATAAEAAAVYRVPVRTFAVDNIWHDWSGFLAFLGACNPATRLLIANDSLTTRRVLSAASIRAVIDSSNNRCTALIGELDTAAESVTLQGQSSPCWISTYLFVLCGLHVNAAHLEALVLSDVDIISANPEHFFMHYLAARRPGLLHQPHALRAKLGAMCFERHLTRLAMNQGAAIVHAFAGSPRRKLERLLERLRDG